MITYVRILRVFYFRDGDISVSDRLARTALGLMVKSLRGPWVWVGMGISITPRFGPLTMLRRSSMWLFEELVRLGG